ncbi:MAG TPA: carboxypeptidase regulatory-like domain-containing protein [Candidatus Tumulicola sp.]
MIEQIDAQVRDWLASTASEAAISFALPTEEDAALTVHAYLYDIDRPLAASSGRLPPVQLRLAYLVTSSGPDPLAAHAVLSKIIAAADANPQFTLEFGPAAATAWTALHLPARAGFVLRATAVKPRDGSIAPPVRSARIDSISLEPIVGRVVATDGTPLPGAIVEAASIGRSVTTDANGRFTLEGATNEIDLPLRVRVKGTSTDVSHPARSVGEYTIAVNLTA